MSDSKTHRDEFLKKICIEMLITHLLLNRC